MYLWAAEHSPPRRGVSRAALLASSITVRKSAERKQRTYRPTSLRGGMAATPIRFREATLIGADGVVSSAKRDRSGLTTPSAPSLRSAQPPLLCDSARRGMAPDLVSS